VILVTGAAGQLGTAFRRLLGEDGTFLGRSELDLADVSRIPATIGSYDPATIINCAGYTAVDRAESEEDLARAVNADAVEALAREAAARSIPFVTFSTDYVFDGRGPDPYSEDDPVAPLNAYGRTKQEGEARALDVYASSLIVRTSWVISGTHKNFISAILTRARTGDLRVVADQRGRPTVASDLAAATMEAVARNANGLLHLANEGATTWFDLARTAVEIAGMASEKVAPCTTDEYPTPAARPAYSVLSTARAASLGIMPMPRWESSLPALVDQMLTWLP
jgi:dTDP-4-dehydrorhamnose reductase